MHCHLCIHARYVSLVKSEVSMLFISNVLHNVQNNLITLIYLKVA